MAANLITDPDFKLLRFHLSADVSVEDYEPTLMEMQKLGEILLHYQPLFDLRMNGIRFSKETAICFREILKKISVRYLQVILRNSYDVEVIRGLYQSRVENLDLSSSTIKVREMIQYLKNNNLRELKINNGNVNDEGLVMLVEHLGHLNFHLALTSDQITDRGAEEIAPILQKVNLKSLTFQHLAIHVDDNPCKRQFSLRLYGNNLTERGRYFIIRTLSNTKKLSLQFRHIKFLNLDFIPLFTHAMMKGTCTIDKVEGSDEVMYNYLLEVINLLSNVNFYGLILENKQLSVENFEAIYKALPLSGMKKISFARNRILNSQMRSMFVTLPTTQITELSIENTGICYTGGVAIAHSMKANSLTHLHIGRNKISRKGLIDILVGIKTSKLVEISLNRLAIDNELLILLIHSLKMSGIVKLNLAENAFNSAGIRSLSQALPETKLVSLDISNNDMSDETLLIILNRAMQCRFCELIIPHRLSVTVLNKSVDILKNYFLMVEFTKYHQRIEQILERNKQHVWRAAGVIEKFRTNQMKFGSKNKEELMSYQLTADFYYLWTDVPNAERVKAAIFAKILENFQTMKDKLSF